MIDNFVTLMPDLGGRHELEATAGGSVELNRGELNFIRGEGFSSDEFKEVRNATIITEFDGDGVREQPGLVLRPRQLHPRPEVHAWVAVSAPTARRGSAPTTGGASSPSVSASWLLSEESGIRGGFFDFLKLRASFGLTGNQAIENYPFQGLVTSANYGETPGIAPDNLPNPDLKWESTAQFDVGRRHGLRQGPGEPDGGLVSEEDQ